MTKVEKKKKITKSGTNKHTFLNKESDYSLEEQRLLVRRSQDHHQLGCNFCAARFAAGLLVDRGTLMLFFLIFFLFAPQARQDLCGRTAPVLRPGPWAQRGPGPVLDAPVSP